MLSLANPKINQSKLTQLQNMFCKSGINDITVHEMIHQLLLQQS